MKKKKLSKAKSAHLHALNKSPRAGYLHCPNNIKAAACTAQATNRDLQAEVRRLQDVEQSLMGTVDGLQGDLDDLQAAHQRLQDEHTALQQVASRTAATNHSLRAARRSLKCQVHNYRHKRRPHHSPLTFKQKQQLLVLEQHPVSVEVLRRCAEAGYGRLDSHGRPMGSMAEQLSPAGLAPSPTDIFIPTQEGPVGRPAARTAPSNAHHCLSTVRLYLETGVSRRALSKCRQFFVSEQCVLPNPHRPGNISTVGREFQIVSTYMRRKTLGTIPELAVPAGAPPQQQQQLAAANTSRKRGAPAANKSRAAKQGNDETPDEGAGVRRSPQEAAPPIDPCSPAALQQPDMEERCKRSQGPGAGSAVEAPLAADASAPAPSLLDLPAALLSDIISQAMQLGATAALARTCSDLLLRVFQLIPVLRIKADSQWCHQLLLPRIAAALQARTSKLALTLQQPKAQASRHYVEVLENILAALGSCASVEACKLSSSATLRQQELLSARRRPGFDVYMLHAIVSYRDASRACLTVDLDCSLGLARCLRASFPGLTALTLTGYSVTCTALAGLLSHPQLSLPLQQLDLLGTTILPPEQPGPGAAALARMFDRCRLKQLSLNSISRQLALPNMQPLAQFLTHLTVVSDWYILLHYKAALCLLTELQYLCIFKLNSTEGLTEDLLQYLPCLRTLHLPQTRIDDEHQLDVLLAATQLVSVQLESVKRLSSSRAAAPCSWRRLQLTGDIDCAVAAHLPLHSLTQPLVVGGLQISSDTPDISALASSAANNLKQSCKVRVEIKWLKLDLDREDRNFRQLDWLRYLGDLGYTHAFLSHTRDFSAADIPKLASMCPTCTYLGFLGGRMQPTVQFWHTLVKRMPELHQVSIYCTECADGEGMCKSLQLMAEQPWVRWLDIRIRARNQILPACWQSGVWVKTGRDEREWSMTDKFRVIFHD
ncbi:hypothetical protein QJQ45_005039 [Haematococcus lacustris]|nr:hypothetical protein QJQ45_005039 [Haematococcus lacustris]